jgi:hypothetical protein
LPAKLANILLYHCPSRPVSTKRLAGSRVDLHRTRVTKAGLLEAQGLTASASAYFERRKFGFPQ